MSETRNPLVKLQDLQHFLAAGTLEESLQQQAAMTARLVGGARCSIMLLHTGEGSDMRMRVYARHGDLPDAALATPVAHDQGIAGQVLAGGESLLVDDIRQSKFAALARAPNLGNSLMSVPIRIDGKIVGVINMANGHGEAPFGDTDLRLLEVAALFIGKSIQVQQLQHLLDSRFAQLALWHEAQQKVGESVRTAYRNPGDIARILARSFFREMTKAGFAPPEIVGAASELITQLNRRLQKNGADSDVL